jgi:hypothetical protein
MWHQAGNVWYTKKIGSMKSAPAGRKTPLPPLHLAIHGTTRRLLPLLGPGRAGGRGDAAMEWARELPTRVYYTLFTQPPSSPPPVVAFARCQQQQHYTRMTHWRNSGPSPRYFSSPSRPARPTARTSHQCCARVNIWMRISMPDENKSPPPADFSFFTRRAQCYSYTFVSQQDLFHSQTLEWIYDFEPVFSTYCLWLGISAWLILSFVRG